LSAPGTTRGQGRTSRSSSVAPWPSD
jgi:hypothetical protein